MPLWKKLSVVFTEKLASKGEILSRRNFPFFLVWEPIPIFKFSRYFLFQVIVGRGVNPSGRTLVLKEICEVGVLSCRKVGVFRIPSCYKAALHMQGKMLPFPEEPPQLDGKSLYRRSIVPV